MLETLTTPITIPTWLYLALIIIVGLIVGFGGLIGNRNNWNTARKLYHGKPLQINEILKNEPYKVLCIATFGNNISNNNEPLFAIVVLEGRKNPEDKASQWFDADMAYCKVSDENGLRIKAGDIIKVTSEEKIEIVS